MGTIGRVAFDDTPLSTCTDVCWAEYERVKEFLPVNPKGIFTRGVLFMFHRPGFSALKGLR
ncbi:hypothetical protein SPFM1_00090 [Salmonella phage SPFM1]|nr:hypothetical protein SPFM1_00090 [Salmonella phage SPFM1]